MSAPDRFVLDANAFIEAHQRYYGFDICPGYWTALKRQYELARLCSIDKIKAELLAQKDELTEWAKLKIPAGFFKQTADQSVIRTYSKLMEWVQSEVQYNTAAKAGFAKAADGWLVAYAKTNGLTVVTLETESADAKKTVPIPNLCSQFAVPCINPFSMLRTLGVRMGLKKRK